MAKVKVWPTDRHASPVTAVVDHNIAAFESRQNLDEPRREVWYDASGALVKRVAPWRGGSMPAAP